MAEATNAARIGPASDVTVSTMADIAALLENLPGPDEAARGRCLARESQLTKPEGALGRLEELSAWLAGWQGRDVPRAEKPLVCVFAANHGVARRGVSAYPADVTAQMVANFRDGGAAINQMARMIGAELRVFELSLERPTGDIAEGPAMDESEFIGAFSTGMKSVTPGCDVVCLGEMGIANTTAAAALCHALFGGSPGDWTGPGTGVGGAALAHKAEVVGRAVRVNRQALGDPLQALRCVGGRELAAIAGAVLAARLRRLPVLLDGYVCTAAAAALFCAKADALDHCRVAHVSAEPGHRRLIERLGARALLDLGMRLGEGTGAALAVLLLKAAAACHSGMATFAEAAVSGKSQPN
jgi:nicotinate-nucleotide--dimethylbenzimidazole phosphoribosyltransferase